MSRVRSQPLLDQKRDLDFRFAAQMFRGASRGFCPPSLLIRGLAVAKPGAAIAGRALSQLKPLLQRK